MVSQHNYYIAVPQPQPIAYAAPIFKAASTKSSSSGSSSATKVAGSGLAGSKGDLASSNNAPPKMSVNANYMFPAEHTKLHIFNTSSKVWEDKHKGKLL
jgi:hypothetical protein